MSGAAVLSSTNDVIGVIRHHNPSEGAGALALTPIEAIDSLPKERKAVFWKHLNLAGPEDINLLPRQENKVDLSKAFTPLFRSRQNDGFVGRRDEIEKLSAFIDGPGGLLAITGRPGFGKTSLLVEFSQQLGSRAAFHFFTSRYDPYWLDEVFFLRNILQQLSLSSADDDFSQLDRLSLQATLHQRLYEAAASSRTPNVLIFDGIDEIHGWSIANYIGGALPKNFHIIVSIRDTGQDWRGTYRLHGPDIIELRLGGLGAKSVVDLFSTTGLHTKLLIQKPGALDAVMRVAAISSLDFPNITKNTDTSADPLYVGLLAKEALEKEFDVAELEQQPEGLTAYLDGWWEDLFKVAGERPALLLFATLAAAHGPLSRTDLESLVPEAFADPTGLLRDHFDRNVLPKIRRVILGNDAAGYTLAHPRFGQHLSTKFTEDVLQSVRQRLLEYCQSWTDNGSGYALTHLPIHTAEIEPNKLVHLYQDANYLTKAIHTLGIDRVIGTLLRVQTEAHLNKEGEDGLHQSQTILEHEAHNLRTHEGAVEAYTAGQLALQAMVMDGKKLYDSAREYLALNVPRGIYPSWTTNTSSDALLRTLSGHTSVVEKASITGGGSRVFTLSLDGSANLWDLQTGVLIHTLRASDSPISAGTITPDGTTAITANSQEEVARVWDAPSGSLLHVLEGHTEEVTAVDIAPNNARAVTTSRDGAYVWDISTGKPVHFLEGHQNWVTSVAISPDGRTVLTTSWDTTACLWNLAEGNLLFRLEGHNAGVSKGLFSADSKTALTISNDSTARLWDVESGTSVHVLVGHESALTSAIFSPGGDQAITTAQDGTARVWDLSTGQTTVVFHHHRDWVTDVAHLGTDNTVATTSRDGTIAVWDVANGQTIKSWKGHSGPVKNVVISASGDVAVTAGDDGTARIWDLDVTLKAPNPEGHSEAITSLGYDSQRALLISASRDSTARVWDSGNGKCQHTLKDHSGPVTALALAPDTAVLVTGSSDHIVRIWDVSTGDLLRQLAGHESGVTAVAVSEAVARVITGDQDGTICLWDLTGGGRVMELPGHTSRIASIRVTDDGLRAISTSWDDTARIWDIKSGNCVHVLRAHSGPVTDAALALNNELLMTIGHDDKPRLWNVSTGAVEASLESHSGPLSALAVSTDGASALTGGWDGTIRLWDMNTKTSKLVIPPLDAGRVLALAFLADGTHCASVHASGSVALWNLPTGHLVQQIRLPSQPTSAIVCGQDGSLMAVGESSGALTVFRSFNG
jgi:WD40 repeat protein